MNLEHDLSIHLIMIIALWRLCNLVVNERGPLSIFEWLRKTPGEIQYDEMSNVIYPNEFSHLFNCLWCCSVWAGLISGFLIEFDKTIQGGFEGALLGLFYAGAIVILDTQLRRR